MTDIAKCPKCGDDMSWGGGNGKMFSHEVDGWGCRGLQIQHLASITDKYPKTKDGETIYPGMQICTPDGMARVIAIHYELGEDVYSDARLDVLGPKDSEFDTDWDVMSQDCESKKTKEGVHQND